MNRRVPIIIRHEFRATVRRRGFVITTALLPVLAIIGLVALGVVQNVRGDGPDEEVAVGYIDLSGLLEGSHRFGGTTFEAFEDRPGAVRALIDGEIESLFEIPSGYLQSGQVVQIQQDRGGLPAFGQTNLDIQALLVGALVGEATPEVVERVQVPTTDVIVLSVDEDGNLIQEPFDGGRLLFFLVVGGLVFFATIMTAGYFQEGLSEEKENRIMEVLLSSSSPRDLMIGKFAALGGLGLMQFSIWVVALVALLAFTRATGVVELPIIFSELSIPTVGGLVAAIGLFLLGYALVGAMMGILGAITTSHREAQQTVFLLILPYLIPVWLWALIIEDPGGVLARVLTLVPFTAPITAMIRLSVDGIGAPELVLTLGILSVTVVAAILLTVRVFELTLLMYGQRPKLREVVRAVFRPAG